MSPCQEVFSAEIYFQDWHRSSVVNNGSKPAILLVFGFVEVLSIPKP